MKLDKKLEEHLATLLEGYENNKEQVRQYIEQTSQQLEGAHAKLNNTEKKIAELKEMLGLEEEAQETMEATKQVIGDNYNRETSLEGVSLFFIL